MYSRLQSFKVPNYVVTIKPEQFNEAIRYNILDYSHYKKVHHVGDIHGCFAPLNKYFKDGLKDDELYIFVGDYIDRGRQNVEVLRFLMEISQKKKKLQLKQFEKDILSYLTWVMLKF